MKVKSFKLIPGVKHQGDDTTVLQPQPAPAVTAAPQSDSQSAAAPTDVIAPASDPQSSGAEPNPAAARDNTTIPVRIENPQNPRFIKKNIVSVDGERLEPGHGIVCEVHQGLLNVICDSKLEKYRPSAFIPPPRGARTAVPEQEQRGQGRRVSGWLDEWINNLEAFERSQALPTDLGEGMQKIKLV